MSVATVTIPVSAKPCNLTYNSLFTEAKALDASDSLRYTRYHFSYPKDTLYFCGNSLGLQPDTVRSAIQEELDRWAQLGVKGHFAPPVGWADAEKAAALSVAPLVGAKTSEVAIMNSLTVNLHMMLTAFYRPEGKRVKILLEQGAFSSDEYALQTHVSSRGLDPNEVLVRLAPRSGETLLREEDILKAIEEGGRKGDLAMVMMGGVQYYSGQVLPMRKMCETGRRVGVIVGFDLAHAVANVELELHDWEADFAVWCSYKYLCAGPGAVGGCFIHEKHGTKKLERLGGWWGHDRESRFGMPRDFRAMKGAAGFQVSNPPIFGLVGVTAAAQMIQEFGGVKTLRKKSCKLTGWLEKVLKERLNDEVEIVTGGENERGSQLSLRVWRVRSLKGGMHGFNERLEKRGVVCDVREPDVLRVAPCAMYNGFEEVVRMVRVLEEELHRLTRSM